MRLLANIIYRNDTFKNLIILCAVIVGCRSDNFPSSVMRCKNGDHVCIANIMNSLIKISGGGVPELGVVPTSPYELANVNVEKGEESPINIKIYFNQVNITGINQIHVDKIVGFDKDPKTSTFKMNGHVEMSTISGPYQVSGKVLLLPIAGSGGADINFEKVKLKVSLQTHVETRNGKDYLIVERVVVKMDTERKCLYLNGGDETTLKCSFRSALAFVELICALLDVQTNGSISIETT